MMYLWVALGSALGGATRLWCSEIIAASYMGSFPLALLIINVIGSFLVGFIAALTFPAELFMISSEIKTFLMIGICGGYTTFSSFSLATLKLIQDGQIMQAGLNILLSVMLCLLAVWLGTYLATLINQFNR